MTKPKLSLIEQAEKARRLAASIPENEVAMKLLKLAEESDCSRKLTRQQETLHYG
jgi:hypothetical protein